MNLWQIKDRLSASRMTPRDIAILHARGYERDEDGCLSKKFEGDSLIHEVRWAVDQGYGIETQLPILSVKSERLPYSINISGVSTDFSPSLLWIYGYYITDQVIRPAVAIYAIDERIPGLVTFMNTAIENFGYVHLMTYHDDPLYNYLVITGWPDGDGPAHWTEVKLSLPMPSFF